MWMSLHFSSYLHMCAAFLAWDPLSVMLRKHGSTGGSYDLRMVYPRKAAPFALIFIVVKDLIRIFFMLRPYSSALNGIFSLCSAKLSQAGQTWLHCTAFQQTATMVSFIRDHQRDGRGE